MKNTNHIERAYQDEFTIVPGYENVYLLPSTEKTVEYGEQNDISVQNISAGSVITFGSFVQNKQNKPESLKWIVIDIKNDYMLLLSEKGLASMEFDEFGGFTGTSWENSDVCRWIKESFLPNAFNEKQVNTLCKPNQTDFHGMICAELAFLLSAEQVKMLNPAYQKKCLLTSLAACQNLAYLNSDLEIPSGWWLADTKNNKVAAMDKGINTVRCDEYVYAIRPAICVDLKNRYFGGIYENVEERKKVELQEALSTVRDSFSGESRPRTYSGLKSNKPEYGEFFKRLEKNYYNTSFVNANEIENFLKENRLLFSAERDNYIEILNILKKKYSDSERPKSYKALKEDNPGFEKEFFRLSKYANETLGMSIAELLVKEGIIVSFEEKNHKKLDEAAAKKEEAAIQKQQARKEYLERKVEKISIVDPKLQKKLDILFNNLERYYPEHAVFALDSLNKDLRERATLIARKIGYKNYDDMLTAYGWKVLSGEEVREIRPCVIYTPGNEPDLVKTRVNNTIAKLHEFYPDHIIKSAVQNDHKSLSSTISGLSQWLGYETTAEFLKAYGFTYLVADKGGRPRTNDYEKIIRELKNKTRTGAYESMSALLGDNPELSGAMQSMSNSAKQLFGMPLGKYLKNEGIIASRGSYKKKEQNMVYKEQLQPVSELIIKKSPRQSDVGINEKLYIEEDIAEAKRKDEEERIAKKKAEEQREAEQERLWIAEEKRQAEEKARKERETAEAERQRIEEAKKKEEFENQERIRKYKEAHDKWLFDCEETKTKRSNRVSELIEEEKAKLLKEASKRRNDSLNAVNKLIENETNRKSLAESTLSSLGLFQFGEKKKQKSIIEEASVKISNANKEIESVENIYVSEVSTIDEVVKKKLSSFQESVAEEIPMPEKPVKPH